ncbi:MAG TPA: apolipoprotein N-acyltransferase [Bryobacteraceae bacterium]|nr:apolipoprotein N-acyltransferase [Bryobacteraceae bacterium]
MNKLPRSPLNFALALLTAALLVLLFPNWMRPRQGLPWLAPIALTPLLIALAREPRPLWRFLLGEFAGIVYWFGICYWIQFVLEVHGNMGKWGGWGTFLLFAVAKAIHLGVFSLFAAVLLNTRLAVPAIAALWTGIERTHSTFGFAWLALGNAAIDMPLPLRLAPFTGVYGISFLFALTAATVAVILLRRGGRPVYWLAMVPGLLLLPDIPAPENGTQTALLVQPNMPEKDTWTPVEAAQTRDTLVSFTQDAARNSGAQLVIWPEVPGPLYYYDDPVFRDETSLIARQAHAYFLFGTVAWTPQHNPLNSGVLLKPDGLLVDRYDKINLVPFGEYTPQFFGWVNRITQEISDFVPGSRIVVFPMDDHRFGAFICYESVFPHEVRQFVKGGAQLLVNISNDGYFGHSSAREQHLEIARMRAVENRRWLLRATNDGITAAIDPAGRITARFPMYELTSGRVRYRYEDSLTFYTSAGDWFAWGCLIGAGVALFFSQIPHYTRPAQPTRAGSPARRRL